MFYIDYLFLEVNQCSKKKFKCDTDRNNSYYNDNQQSIGITDGKLLLNLVIY